jgi:hypothetical protein
VDAFKVGSTQFVGLPFYSDGNTVEYRLELLVFNETTEFLESVQNISTFGVTGVAAMDSPAYLAVSNAQYDAGPYNAPSYVLKYNFEEKEFQPWQNISTSAARSPAFFRLGSIRFLAFPNYYDDTTGFSTNSVVFTLNIATGYFFLNQSIPTVGGDYMHPWTHNSLQYLAVVNLAGGGYTDVFKFSGVEGQFVNVSDGSRLYTTRPNGADVIDISGNTFMVVTTYQHSFATIYRWRQVKSRFEVAQELAFPYSSIVLLPHFFKIETDTFLAMADIIYKYCDSQFVVV